MGYVTREMIDRAKEMDLLTYLQTYEPQELVHFGGSTYCTREHDSLKISNGKWCWFSRGIGGRTALDYAIAPRRPLDTRGMSPLQVSLCTGRHRDIAWLPLESGADVSVTDHYGRNCLMEAVSEAGNLCPVKNQETGAFYPGRPITPEMCEDLRRIFRLLIDAGADRNNVSAFSGKSIRQHYENEPVWQICGDLWDERAEGGMS